jgi:hypothetical protein
VSSYYAFSAPVYLGEGDFNNDGYEDFAVPNSYSATSMSVILNHGDGTFAAPHTYAIAQTGYEIEVADFDDDGNDDFAVRGGSEHMVHYGKGDGTFYPEVTYGAPAGRFEAGAHGDFNGDGAADLVFPGTSGLTVLTNDAADFQRLAGAVAFTLSSPATTTSGSVLPMTITAVDASGKVATGIQGTVYISSSDPAATTAAGYAFNPLDAGIPYVFTAADAGTHTFTGGDPARHRRRRDRDGSRAEHDRRVRDRHRYRAGEPSRVRRAVRGERGRHVPGHRFGAGHVRQRRAGLLQRDPLHQLRRAGGAAGRLHLRAGRRGRPHLRGGVEGAGARFIGATEVGGTIGDGATVTVAPLAATSFALTGGGGAIGASRPVSVVARDVYGNVATSYHGTAHVTSSDPLAVLAPDATLVNGAATVNVALMTVGTQTITATDVADPTLTGRASSDATPPVPATFAVTACPATVAGAANGFTVTVRDTIGQVATGYTGTVFFSSSDVQAGLPASYTFTAADAGAHTFNVGLHSATPNGVVWSVTATDTRAALAATMTNFEVANGAASSVSLKVPTNITAGAAFALKLVVLDAWGNTVKNYFGTVHFADSLPAFGLPPDYTFTGADAGVASFSATLDTTGNQVLSVTDTSNGALTASATVSPTAPSTGGGRWGALAAEAEAEVRRAAVEGEEVVSAVVARDAAVWAVLS